MFCPECGQSVSDTASSCPNCTLNLARNEPFSPYIPPMDSGYMWAISLLLVPSLILLLKAISMATKIVIQEGGQFTWEFRWEFMEPLQWGMLGAMVVPITIGLVATLAATKVDKARNHDDLPAARKSAKAARRMAMFGWVISAPIIIAVIGYAFVQMLTESPEGGEKAAAAETAAETAPAAAEADAKGTDAKGTDAKPADAKAAAAKAADAKKADPKKKGK